MPKKPAKATKKTTGGPTTTSAPRSRVSIVSRRKTATDRATKVSHDPPRSGTESAVPEPVTIAGSKKSGTLSAMIDELSASATASGARVSIQIHVEPSHVAPGSKAVSPAPAARARAFTAAAGATTEGGLRIERFDVTATSGVSLLGVTIDDINVPLARDGQEWSGHKTLTVHDDRVVVFIEAHAEGGDALLELTVSAGDDELEVRRLVSPSTPFAQAYPLVLS